MIAIISFFKRALLYVTVTVIVVLGVGFAMLNSQLVSLDYFVNARQIPLALLLAMTFIVGSLCGMIAALNFFFRAKRQVRLLKAELKSTKKELENLRAIPFNDKH